MVGNHECVPLTASSTFIECNVDTKETLLVGFMHPISLSVNNRGLAINQVMTPSGRSFRMIPSIDEISLATGSVEGGTRLLLLGDGFSAASPDEVHVVIGGAPCVVDSVSYREVECVTTKPDVLGTFEPTLTINFAEAEICNSSVCLFTYEAESTPIVTSVSPAVVAGASTSLTIIGTGFSSVLDEVSVTVGGVECSVIHASESEIQCNVGYVPAGDAALIVNILNQGNSALAFDDDKTTLWSATDIYTINPYTGSVQGGQLITITGSGFHVDDTVVTIDGIECIIESITISDISCRTQSHSSGSANLVVTSSSYNYPVENYEYSSVLTPVVNSVSPSNGETGDAITLSGSGFGADISDNLVLIDGVECAVTSASIDSIECIVGSHSAGMYAIELHVNAIGNAISGADFEYVLAIGSTTPNQSKYLVSVPFLCLCVC